MESIVTVVNVQTPSVSSKVAVVTAPPKKPNPTPSSKVVVPVMSSKVEVREATPKQPQILSSVVQVQEEPAVVIGNNIGEPEYDFLSKQPSEVVEETYKVINLKPSSKFHLKPRPTADAKGEPLS